MTNLSVISEVAVETIALARTMAISSAASTSLACLVCGEPKALYSYIGNRYDVVFTKGSCACRGANAPNLGGFPTTRATYDEERRMLLHLFNCESIEEIHKSIARPPLHVEYRHQFEDVLSRLYQCTDLHAAQDIIMRYASADEMRDAE